MRTWILVVSLGALVCAGIGLLVGSPGANAGYLVLGLALAATASILSAIHARRLQRPGWAIGWVCVTLLGVGSVCGAVFEILSHIDVPTSPDIVALTTGLIATPLVALPVFAIFYALLFGQGAPRSSTPTFPPAGTA